MQPRTWSSRTYLPFVAVTAFGFLLAFAPGRGVAAWAWLIAGCLALLSGGWRLVEYRHQRPSGLLSSMLFLAGVGFLRQSVHGTSGGLGILVMLPLLWTALEGNRRQLLIVTVAVAVTLLAPQVLVGAPNYPVTGWRSGILLVAVGAIVAHATQALVRQLRLSVALADERGRERDELLGRLQHQAETDALTEVANRRLFERRVQAAFGHSSGSASAAPFCVAMLDLDHFKEVNDRDGHLAGDVLLRDCVSAWKGALRLHDLLARFGGDEFAVLLPDCDVEEAELIIDRLRRLTPEGTTVSVGLAEAAAGETSAELMQRVDAAMYEAKSAGRDQIAVLS
jgi:diguanylate cyclase (GGDEF)-like protein